MRFCYHDGHDVRSDVRNCPLHGAPVFRLCRRCEASWPAVLKDYSGRSWAADLCESCGEPAPWVSRAQRVAWIKARLRQEGLDSATERELNDLIDVLAAAPEDDPGMIAGWRQVKTVAPKLWHAALPVLQSLVANTIMEFL
jgi:hypothetical protein